MLRFFLTSFVQIRSNEIDIVPRLQDVDISFKPFVLLVMNREG